MAEDSLPIDWEFPLEHFSIDWESIPEFCQGLQQQDSSPLSTNNGMSSGHSTTVHFVQPQHPLVSIVQTNKIFHLTGYSVRFMSTNHYQREIPSWPLTNTPQRTS